MCQSLVEVYMGQSLVEVYMGQVLFPFFFFNLFLNRYLISRLLSN